MDLPDTPRTIYTTYRSQSRFARIRLRHPGPRQPRLRLSDRITAIFPALRAPEEPTDYTPELAMELLARTCDPPETKVALHIVIGEYRNALHALATQALNQQTATE